MPTAQEVAHLVVDHVGVHGCDEDYYDHLNLLKAEVGGHPNDIMPILREAGLPQALLQKGRELRQGGNNNEAQRMFSRAARFGPEYGVRELLTV